MPKMRLVVFLFAGVCLTTLPNFQEQPSPPPPSNPSEMSEQNLIQQIRKLRADREQGAGKQWLELRVLGAEELLQLVDTLLERFPTSSFREEATIIKLEQLAESARFRPDFLLQLLALNAEISSQKPTGRLAAENAFFGIQAFVLGARHEKMPEDRRLMGTLERYQAFLEDYPCSERRPVIWASLIRNLLALRHIERAKSELEKMRREFSDHAATRRAHGEVNRALAVGHPYRLVYRTGGEETIRSEDYRGKVLVVHFWASWSTRAVEELRRLAGLYERFKDQGLDLIGINVDVVQKKAQECLGKNPLPWPQYFDFKGFENPALIDSGVTELPAYFIVDRGGVLRATDPGDQLETIVEELLHAPAPEQE